jgi:SAM-dependent methyltransferase
VTPEGAPSAADLNLAWWEERAALHGQDGSFYDTDAFLAGADAITERELDAITDAANGVAGRAILHLQCHIGLTTLTLARMGASVTGVDFSRAAVAKAEDVAARAGLEASFVVADAQDLPPELDGRFDAVFASYGVIMWIASMDAWMRSAERTLAPGGSLVLVEGHPLAMMVRSASPPELWGPYLGGSPVRRHDHGDYAAGDVDTTNDDTVLYRHGLGEIVTAAADAGLRVASLVEWMDEPDLASRPDSATFSSAAPGRSRMAFAGSDLPVQFSLRALKR